MNRSVKIAATFQLAGESLHYIAGASSTFMSAPIPTSSLPGIDGNSDD